MSILYPSPITGAAFLFKKHERQTCILKVKGKGVLHNFCERGNTFHVCRDSRTRGSVIRRVLRSSRTRACLQGEIRRVTLASGSTLAGGQKVARVYKQSRVTLQPEHSKSLETSGKLTRVGGFTWTFYKEKREPACQGNPSTQIG